MERRWKDRHLAKQPRGLLVLEAEGKAWAELLRALLEEACCLSWVPETRPPAPRREKRVLFRAAGFSDVAHSPGNLTWHQEAHSGRPGLASDRTPLGQLSASKECKVSHQNFQRKLFLPQTEPSWELEHSASVASASLSSALRGLLQYFGGNIPGQKQRRPRARPPGATLPCISALTCTQVSFPGCA